MALDIDDWPEPYRWRRKRSAPKVLVIVAPPRSGTTALGLALGSSEQLRHYGEIFHQVRAPQEARRAKQLYVQIGASFFNYREARYARDAGIAFPSAENQREIFDGYLEFLHARAGRPIAGLDIKYNSWHHFNGVWQYALARPALADFLNDVGAVYLHLTRADALAQVCSLYIAVKRDVWHRRRTAAGDKPEPVTISPAWARQMIERTTAQRELFRKWLTPSKRYMEWNYEQLFERDSLSGAMLDRLENLLERPIRPVGSVPLKKIVRSLESEVANYERLRELFGTPES